MFFTYLRRELRRRRRQAIITSAGLALGIGLVITVTAASAGVKAAQGTVLQDLYGVGTSATVTKAPTAGSFIPGSGARRFDFKPGSTVRIDQLTADRSLGSLDAADVTAIAKLNGVAAASGSVTAANQDTTFKIPDFTGGGTPGGGTPGGSRSGGFGGFRGPGSFNAASQVTVNGVDLASGSQPLGPLSNGTLTAGRTFTAADADSPVAVVDSSYARSASLKLGGTVTIAGKKFTVIGIVSDPAGDSPSDIYIPLRRAQALATPSMTGKVNTIYVAAANAADIPAVQQEIKKLLPGATVTTSADLASEVTGSLASAASLANNLGKWLAIAVLAAAFALASLLTMSAVSRRVREFGTLKALGWRSRRVIGQVMGESVVMGIAGAIAGVGLGFGGAALLTRLVSPLSASVPVSTGSATPGGARTFGGGFGGPGSFGGPGGFTRPGGSGSGLRGAAAHPSLVHLTAPVTLDIVVVAVALAVAGGLLAGMFGGWRAARLRPAAALARVE
jgi:putative ABC transport system permease protein